MQNNNNVSSETPNPNKTKICVRFGRDEVYRWALPFCGAMETASRTFLNQFMERHKIDFYIFKEKDERPPDELVLG